MTATKTPLQIHAFRSVTVKSPPSLDKSIAKRDQERSCSLRRVKNHLPPFPISCWAQVSIFLPDDFGHDEEFEIADHSVPRFHLKQRIRRPAISSRCTTPANLENLPPYLLAGPRMEEDKA
jgi:hypothetical protein